MNRPTNEKALSALKSLIASKGIRDALRYLNSLTSHRFTSLYRFDGETLRNVIFFDRENPNEDQCADIPVNSSYCIFVRNLGALFHVEDSQKDSRVTEHPKRDVIQCYCGVPLLDRDGRMFGTICHFDVKAGKVSSVDIELLESMAVLLKANDAIAA